MPGTRFTLEVQPQIPVRLSRLSELANNLFYAWEHQITGLFARLDSALWSQSGHNPKLFLRRISQQRLEEAAVDPIFLEDYNRAVSVFDTYIREKARSGVEKHLNSDSDLVAYFCAEFGFHESFPIYSGGLGILAGDHCKAASDLLVPFVAVGMLYRQGYFTQTIDDQGNQLAHYTPTNFANLPISPAIDPNGSEIHVHIDIEDRHVSLKVWKANIGHIQLYLLDSDLPVNADHDRRITYQLYGGDIVTRIQQEIVLGIGGVRAIRALGLTPSAWHINEGHAAFLILERIREYVSQGLEFDTALELVAAATVYTTHTPVPAGHDIFNHDLVMRHFERFIGELRIDRDRFLRLGSYPGDPHGFNQTALALRGSRLHNGVSRIHGTVASNMESYIWPEIIPEENPIDYITNGVHVPTFLAQEWANLFERRIGADWRKQLRNDKYWEKIDEIPEHTYWSTHQSLKLELFEYAQKHLVKQHRRNGCSEAQITNLTRLLNPQDTDVLVIGFARRFATYKRATLMFADIERLRRILNDTRHPVLFLFSGKAHPKDKPGQDFIRMIHEFSRLPEFEGKILLLEGYDIALARRLVAGVDVWLNTPEYPLEASGTSGQKAGINGVINLSVLDGWWGEGFNGHNGWAIKTHGQEFAKQFRDHVEAQDLLNLLENSVIPLYYARESLGSIREERRGERPRHSLSRGWIAMSKASMKTIIPRFNAARMMMDYVTKFYGSASQQRQIFENDNYAVARDLAQWKNKIRRCWPRVRIFPIQEAIPEAITSGETMRLRVPVHLDELTADDIVIECLIGIEDEYGKYIVHECHKFEPIDHTKNGDTTFSLNLSPSLPGLQYYKIRMYPYHRHLVHSFELGYMRWL